MLFRDFRHLRYSSHVYQRWKANNSIISLSPEVTRFSLEVTSLSIYGHQPLTCAEH